MAPAEKVKEDKRASVKATEGAEKGEGVKKPKLPHLPEFTIPKMGPSHAAGSAADLDYVSPLSGRNYRGWDEEDDEDDDYYGPPAPRRRRRSSPRSRERWESPQRRRASPPRRRESPARKENPYTDYDDPYGGGRKSRLTQYEYKGDVLSDDSPQDSDSETDDKFDPPGTTPGDVDLLAEILLQYGDDKGPVVLESLQTAINDIWAQGGAKDAGLRQKKLFEKHLVPENSRVQRLEMNEELLRYLSRPAKAKDIRMRGIQGAISRSVVPITKMVEMLMTRSVDRIEPQSMVNWGSESIRMLASANATLNQIRREAVRPFVAARYSDIALIKPEPESTLLFGDKLPEKIKAVGAFGQLRLGRSNNGGSRQKGHRQRSSNYGYGRRNDYQKDSASFLDDHSGNNNTACSVGNAIPQTPRPNHTTVPVYGEEQPRGSETSIADDGEEEVLVGISMASEANVGDPSKDLSLGLITTSPSKCNLVQLRNLICIQIHTTPISFKFLTKEGWVITKSQESKICASQVLTSNGVVRIHRCYDKPRIGVRTREGKALGFVFADHSHSINMLRNIVIQQLGHIASTGDSIYQFLDRNGWPISKDQENSLAVIDVLVDGCVQVCPPLFSVTSASNMEAVDFVDALEDEPDLKKRRIDFPALPFQLSKDQGRQISEVSSEDTFETKQVLISYVRREAAQHALTLKQELTSLDYSVYLDVHEIKSGIDWQDSLNYAVRNCEIFIPLVTPLYGETQWTNREVKLADVMSKLIVPVNFLDYWPPKCLAIQFATTQYIPWKKVDPTQGSSTDIRCWSPESVEEVSQKIAERIEEFQRLQRLDSNTSGICRKVSMLRSYPSSLPDGLSQLSKVSEDRVGPPLVVISVHPEQRRLAYTLKSLFEVEGYEVWCSCEMVESKEDPEVIPSSPEESILALSQGSHFSSQLSQMSEGEYTDQEKSQRFLEKADEAGVVICVLSKAFAASKTSKQQVFYCEHRKRVISLRCEEFRMPSWMSMLIGTGIFEDASAEGFEESLRARVKRSLDPTARNGIQGEVCEDRIAYHVQKLRKRMPKETYVYIAGGTKFFHKDSEAICQAIGKYLASMDDIHVVTGGFYGVGETIGTYYDQEKRRRNEISNIWHVLPERDDQDRSRQGRQNKDRTFPMMHYGKTVYTGDSVRQREMVVSRVFDICILVEGGPGAAHEAEQFAWNDHVVIPVSCTGGAAGGKFNVPQKIFELPLGVDEEDWALLANKNARPDELGQSVMGIVKKVRERLRLDSPSISASPTSPLKLNKPRKRKVKSALARMKTFVL